LCIRNGDCFSGTLDNAPECEAALNNFLRAFHLHQKQIKAQKFCGGTYTPEDGMHQNILKMLSVHMDLYSMVHCFFPQTTPLELDELVITLLKMILNSVPPILSTPT